MLLMTFQAYLIYDTNSGKSI